eukprot:tig00020610_g12080.t1
MHLDNLEFYAVIGTAESLEDGDEIRRLSERLQSSMSGQVDVIVMDTRSDQSVQDAKRIVEDIVGDNGLYAVVNNAAVQRWGAAEGDDIAACRDLFETNFWGYVRVTRAFLPLLRKNRAAARHVVFMSSVEAFLHQPGWGFYSASKAAVEAWADALRREVSRLGIRVSLVRPGFTATRMIWGQLAALDTVQKEVASGKPTAPVAGDTAKYKGLEPSVVMAYSDLERDLIRNFQGPGARFLRADPRVPVAAVVDALLHTRPRPRYETGLDARIMAAASRAPDALQDTYFRALI